MIKGDKVIIKYCSNRGVIIGECEDTRKYIILLDDGRIIKKGSHLLKYAWEV